MHDIVVVGGGIHGLSAAFHLRRRGRGVVVIDRFGVGHDRGGSHGSTRITRSSYHDRRYVQLAQRTQQQGWPLFEAELGQQLVHATPGLFFGPPEGLFADFLTATLDSGVDVEQIDRAAAQRSFPLLRFDAGDVVMLDHTAGVLAAADTMSGLRDWLQANGVEIRDRVTVTQIHAAADAISIETESETIRSQNVVVAAGAWLGELLPEWRQSLTVLRQEVGYVQVETSSHELQVGAFPVWCRIGVTAADFVYGLPEFGRPGLKVAHHRTVGSGDDPNLVPSTIDREALAALARERLTPPEPVILSSEHCLYSVAPNEQLQVRRSAMDPRIIGVAACSGHGFKFGPVIGEQVADLLVPR